jgi:hypothetical protein
MGRVVNTMPRPLYRRQRNPVTRVQGAEWGPGPVWDSAENLVPTGTECPDRPALASRRLQKISLQKRPEK